MIQNEREIRHEYVLQAVRQMMTAARTAPKGKGIDIIEVAMVTDEDIKRLSEELVIMSGETGLKFFLRDADNILQAEAIMIAGTRQQVQGLNCAHFGLCHGVGFAPGYTCDVQCRYGCTAFGNVGRLQMCDGDSGKRVLEKPVLRSKNQNRVSHDKV